MASLYPWFVFIHLLGLVLFAVGHGVSMFAAFRARAGRQSPPAVAGALDASSMALGPMYIGLLLLGIGGLGAAQAGDQWAEPYVIASIVVVVIVIGAMYGLGTPYYRQVREGLGVPIQGKPPTGPALPPEELARLLDSRRPEILLAIGAIGLVLLLWLMVLKPALW
jgi:hypothetical protein